MSSYRGLASRFYLQTRYGMTDKLKEIQALEYMNLETLRDVQREKIKKIVRHAYRNVPYYGSVLSACGLIDNNQIVNIERFSSVPILDKTTIRSNFVELQSKDLKNRRWFYNTSGGSTGEPVRFIQDSDVRIWHRAVKILFDQWTGFYMGDRQIRLWGSERDILQGRETVRVRLGQWFRNEVWQNAYRMTHAQKRCYVDQINSFKPVQILAYVESIYDLSCYIENQGIDVHSPRSIMVSAGVLFPHMRETIERVFGAPVYNRYGSREVGDMACECSTHDGLHVSYYSHFIEILRSDNKPTLPGEIGEVVVTSLTNFAMPLIRYRIGDLAAWSTETCSCGRSWPLLTKLVGRATDLFIASDGAKVHGLFFNLALFYKDWVFKYQIIQEKVDFIRVLIVPKYNDYVSGRYDRDLEEISKNIRFVLGQKCKVKIEFVERIPVSMSGKHQYLVSKLKN